MEKIEIGYTVEKERWLEAAENLHEFGRIMAQNLRGMNRDGSGAGEILLPWIHKNQSTDRIE